MMKRMPLSVVLLAVTSLPAAAHPGGAPAADLLAGLFHPLSGLDHVIAMIALGAWAAVSGARSLWLLPIAFLAAMGVGGLLGHMGLPLPMAEVLILSSAVFLAAFAFRRVILRDWLAAAITVLFAIAHGHVHGAELPQAVSALPYAAGFLAATAALHLAGIAFVYLTSRTELRARRATS